MHGPLYYEYYERLLFLLHVFALAGVLVRFLASGLHRVYRFFFLYLIAQCTQLAVPLIAPNSTNLYGYLYLLTEGVIVVFYALIVLELYSLVLKDLPGIATLARRYVQIALTAAIVLSVLLLQVEQVPKGILASFHTFERTIIASLVVFVFLITAFLIYFPVPLNRNVIYYSIGYALYFSTKAVALLLLNTGHESNSVASMALFAGSIACLLFWAVFLTRNGEQKTMIAGHRWGDDDEGKLIRGLEAINADLMRARK